MSLSVQAISRTGESLFLRRLAYVLQCEGYLVSDGPGADSGRVLCACAIAIAIAGPGGWLGFSYLARSWQAVCEIC